MFSPLSCNIACVSMWTRVVALLLFLDLVYMLLLLGEEASDSPVLLFYLGL